MRKLLLLGLLVIPLSVYALASNSIIGFVSESSMNNTLYQYPVGTGPITALGMNCESGPGAPPCVAAGSGPQTACPNYSYCVPFAGKTLSGNLAILPYTYAYS